MQQNSQKLLSASVLIIPSELFKIINNKNYYARLKIKFVANECNDEQNSKRDVS